MSRRCKFLLTLNMQQRVEVKINIREGINYNLYTSVDSAELAGERMRVN